MNVLKTASLLLVGLTIAGHAFAEESTLMPGFGGFGIAPAPSSLIDGQRRVAADTKSLESVIEMIRLRLPGRALGARLVEWKGREAYEIRWIGDNGVVRDITADAVSGDILDER